MTAQETRPRASAKFIRREKRLRQDIEKEMNKRVAFTRNTGGMN